MRRLAQVLAGPRGAGGPMRRLVIVALALLAGCGGDDEQPEPPAPQPTFANPRGESGSTPGAIAVSAPASGEPRFEQRTLQAEAGEVTFEFTNPTGAEHSFCVESDELGTLGCTALFRSNTSTLRVQLERGGYTFFCSAPGHRQAGMEGTLRVR
jgi:plastocyanin